MLPLPLTALQIAPHSLWVVQQLPKGDGLQPQEVRSLEAAEGGEERHFQWLGPKLFGQIQLGHGVGAPHEAGLRQTAPGEAQVLQDAVGLDVETP